MAQTLSFKKVSSLPSSNLGTGTIYFNSTTHSIFVATSETTTEEYGGRIADVTFSGGILTITKHSDTAGTADTVMKLDFSDVASSSDVSKVCGALADRVGTLESSVSANATNISKHDTRIAALEAAAGFNDGDGNSLADRVTAAEGEIDTLQTTVGNSSSGLVQKVNSNAAAITALQKEKANETGDAGKTFSVATPTADSHAATKKYVDTAVSSVYKVKGTKATKADLPTTGNTTGDVWNVTAASGTLGSSDYVPAGTNYVWTGSAWDALGGTVDLSTYATNTDLSAATTRIGTLEGKLADGVVNTFAGKTGKITINTAPISDGQITFSIDSNNQLNGSVKGIGAAAYKAVDTSMTETSTSTNLPTTKAVASALSTMHSTINAAITSNSKMTWANEW